MIPTPRWYPQNPKTRHLADRPGTRELIEFGQLSPARRGELEGDEVDPWEAGQLGLEFRPKQRHIAVEDSNGTLLAAAGLVVAEAQVGEARFPVVGLGGVIVRAPFRGRGLAREVVEAALNRARMLGPAFALLFCLESRVGLYRRLGFARIEAEVRVRQPGSNRVMPMCTMWQALRPDAVWPHGELVLNSLPF